VTVVIITACFIFRRTAAALGGGLSQLGVSQLELERFLVGNLFSNCTAEGTVDGVLDFVAREAQGGYTAPPPY
jgi:hypothetical protein